MSAPPVPSVQNRSAITAYHRDRSRPLRVFSLEDAGERPAIEQRRVRWAPYLTGSSLPEAPLATRFVPLLAAPVDRDAEDDEVAWPATLYPYGFRNQVLGHCALQPAASWVAESGRPGGVVHRICRGLDLPAEAGGWSASVRLRMALTFNSLSLYRATVELFGRFARTVTGNPHLTYEVARAAYQIGAVDGALRAFVALSGAECPSLPIRLNAASRLVAHYARSGTGLDSCAHWVESSTALAATADSRTDFATLLAVSRVHRAAALHASRRRDPDAVVATLSAADSVDRVAEQFAGSELRRLECAQNRRLILEAALKAYVATGGRVDALGAARSAERLAALDPWDPYTRLTVGDAWWIHGSDEFALASYDAAVLMGTLVGAHAAHRGAELLNRTGRHAEARVWWDRAIALDPAAAGVERSDG